MRRRDFIGFAAAASLCPPRGFAQVPVSRFADMHAHLGFRGEGFRAPMEKGGMLLVAEKVTPDSLLLRVIDRRLRNTREAQPGEMRRYFDTGLERRKARMRQEGMAEVSSVASLERVLRERTPAVVIAAEGADFLEGDLSYVEKCRAQGLAHLQIVHYYAQTLIADISTEEPTRGGLTGFGRDLVRACNRLGILVDVAHCSNQAMEQVVELSSRPVVYSHGHVSANPNPPSMGGLAARAVHAPVAKLIAAKGGVVGLWPNWYSYANLELYSAGLARLCDALGPQHVGIGSDLHGMPRTVMPSYAEFALLEGELARRGLKQPEIDGILGGNYVRVLGEAMKA
jgi:membrane dipeptidase